MRLPKPTQNSMMMIDSCNEEVDLSQSCSKTVAMTTRNEPGEVFVAPEGKQ